MDASGYNELIVLVVHAIEIAKRGQTNQNGLLKDGTKTSKNNYTYYLKIDIRCYN